MYIGRQNTAAVGLRRVKTTTAVVVTTTSWASDRASADANTTAAPFAPSCRRRRPAVGWCTACRRAPARARPPVWATTGRWPRPRRDGPRACPSPVAPVSSCTCDSGTRFSPETKQRHVRLLDRREVNRKRTCNNNNNNDYIVSSLYTNEIKNIMRSNDFG